MPNDRAPFPSSMGDNQKKIFMDRYSKRDETGTPIESYLEACIRVSTVIASVVPPDLAYRVCPELFSKDVPLQELFLSLIYNMEFLPNSPTWTGASVTGDTDGQLAACFVLDMQDSLSSIMKAICDAVQIQKRGGGNGFPLHFLRPEGAIISKSRGKSTGPVGFLRAKDKIYGEIEQGGVRRGANMAVMMVWHPDVLKFIECKNLDTASFGEKNKWFGLLEKMAELELSYEFVDEDGVVRDVSFREIYEGFKQHMTETKITNFNISVGITDEFMRAVESDSDFKMSFPGFPEFDKTVRARKIMDAIAENAYKNGEPGMLFFDAANVCRVIEFMLFEATNPCGEQYLIANGTCTLGSTNFVKFFRTVCRESVYAFLPGDEKSEGNMVPALCNVPTPPFSKLHMINFEEMRRIVILSVIFLDCVVSANKYVAEVPAVEETAKKFRNIGLGPMGVADLFFLMGITYGSDEALYYTHVLMSHFQYYAMYASIRLAAELGPFPEFKGSRLDRDDPLFYSGKVRNPTFFPEDVELDLTFPVVYKDNSVEGRRARNVEIVTHMWDSYCENYPEGNLAKLAAQYGVRHITETTVAPTGTISNVAGLFGGGCEPAYALTYTRLMKNKDQQYVSMRYWCNFFLDALQAAGLSEGEIETVKQQVIDNDGSCQGIPFFADEDSTHKTLKEIERVFVIANDLSGRQHVLMQAAFQYWISNSVSKTCNLPASATKQDIIDIYFLAWKMGCKGCTVYRDKSRAVEVLSKVKKPQLAPAANITRAEYALDGTDKTEGTNLTDDMRTLAMSLAGGRPVEKILRKKEKNIYYGKTIHQRTVFGQMLVTVNDDEHGPFEILILIGKAGSDLLANAECYGRSASVLLQSTNDPETRITLLKRLIKQWKGIGGGQAHGFGENRFISIPDTIARCIESVVFATDERVEVESPVYERAVPLESATKKKFSGECCPDCHMMAIVHQEGCAKCTNCDYTKCS